MPFAKRAPAPGILGVLITLVSSCSHDDISQYYYDAAANPANGASPEAGTVTRDAAQTPGGSGDAAISIGRIDSGSVGSPDARADSDDARAVTSDADSVSADAGTTPSSDAGATPANDAAAVRPDAGSSDAASADAASGPAVPKYTLQVDAPASGASVKNPVKVRGRAPGFLNVEVWDAQHQKPPLGRVTPATDGSFEVSIDITGLASGATTWTVHAWDSAPGSDFTNTDSVDLPLMLDTGSTKPPDAPAGGTADPGTKYVPSGYTLKFSDEFTGAALDGAKWNTLGPFGVRFFEDSKQKQYFVPNAVSLTDGVVRFTAKKSAGGTEGQPYSSGSITTNGTFTHGYYEARVKVPSGKGYWPAFWVTSSTRWPPEWDIFEIIDDTIFGYPHPVQGGKCQFVEGAAGSDSTYKIPNLYNTWHVYGFHWTATDVYWYVDGVLTEHYAINAAAGANDPFWVNLSLQVGGTWPGDPDSTTPFPGIMDVDYLRIYQN